MADEKPIKLIWVVTAYGFTVSMLYLIGYWSSFYINIFEYITLSDVIKLALSPVLVGAFFVLSGLIVRVFLFDWESIKKVETEKVFIIVSPKVAKWIRVILLLSIFPLLMFYPSPFKWIWVGCLFTIAITPSINDFGILTRLFPNPIVRSLLSYAAILVLSTSFGIGKLNAETVLTGKSVKVVSTQIFREKDQGLPNKGIFQGQRHT